MDKKQPDTLRGIELPGITKINSGKVREIFELEGMLLLVASDRLSAFDVVLPDPIPYKGRVLTQMSKFWFDHLTEKQIVKHHLISVDFDEFPKPLQPFRAQLEWRSTLVRKCKPLPIECVVRGYMAGSGWKEYQKSGSICGIQLPPGLTESSKLPEAIFTPSTKAESGHDINISFEQAVEMVGSDTATRVRDLTLKIYRSASDYARSKGIIICDTKFEFGWVGDDLILIDEVLTPDSSRFWPADDYEPGRPQASYDKQYVRDYLETLDWAKTYPGPKLPAHVIEATSGRYLEAYEKLTGKSLV